MKPPSALAQAVWHSCNNGGCVEVAMLDGQIWVRGSGDADDAVLRFTPNEWTAFLDGAREGRFDPARLISGG